MSNSNCIETIPCIKQGDACSIPVKLYFNGEAITADVLPLLEEIEFAFGDEDLKPVRIPAAESWSDTLGMFLLPVTQKQTFALDVGLTTLDVRVRFRGGGVLGVREKAKMKVADATSEEVI